MQWLQLWISAAMSLYSCLQCSPGGQSFLKPLVSCAAVLFVLFDLPVGAAMGLDLHLRHSWDLSDCKGNDLLQPEHGSVRTTLFVGM